MRFSNAALFGIGGVFVGKTVDFNIEDFTNLDAMEMYFDYVSHASAWIIQAAQVAVIHLAQFAI